MKRICFIILITIAGIHPTLAQEYSFPLYFEDSAGNKDTLWFGFDENATFDIDEELGEVNLINEPLDSVFNVFFTDAAVSIKDWYFEFERSPNYISKKQYITGVYLPNWFELGIVAKYWPVTISWNKSEMQKYVSSFSYTANMFLYSWSPPQSLLGDVYTCGTWPNDYTMMNETDSVVVDYENFCHYHAPSISTDSLSPFYIKHANFTDINQYSISPVIVSYNANQKTLTLLNFPKNENISIEIFDLNGSSRIKEYFDCIDENQLTISTEKLPNGVYLVQVIVRNQFYYNQTQKIVIQ